MNPAKLGIVTMMALWAMACGAEKERPDQPVPITGRLSGFTPIAAHSVTFRGGFIANKTINVLFFGAETGPHAITADQKTETLAYLNYFIGYINGVGVPTGLEPTVRAYGITGASLGTSLTTTDAFVQQPIVSNRKDPRFITEDQDIKNHISTAQNAGYGGRFLPPTDPNQLYLVMVPSDALLVGPDSGNPASGYHQTFGSAQYAVAKINNFNGISHESIETMTDPSPWDGWATEEGFLNLTHYEGADGACDNDNSDVPLPYWPDPVPNAAGDLGLVAEFVSNFEYPAYGLPYKSCHIYLPEQYSPIAYAQADGRIRVYTLNSDGNLYCFDAITPSHAAPNAHLNLAKPAATTLEGKPTAVVFNGADFVFVRGGDGHLWANSGSDPLQWNDLGSPNNLGIYGDPSAVVRNDGANIDVFVLGADRHLWDVYWTGSAWQWVSIFSNAFSGSPTAVSRSAATMDVFILGVDLKPYWTTFDGSSFRPFVRLNDYTVATTPGISTWGPNRLDLFFKPTGPTVVTHQSWSGGWGAVEGLGQLNGGTAPAYNIGPPVVPAAVSWGPDRIDAFTIDTGSTYMYHTAYTTAGGWENENHTVLVSGATGHPVATTWGPNTLNVFYRDLDGSLHQLEFNNNAWNDWILSAGTSPPTPPIR